MLKTIVISVIAAVVIPLAIVLIRFNRKRLHIIRCAEAATPEQLEAIYAHIDVLGTESPSCALLARTNRRSASNDDWTLPIPPYVEPWAAPEQKLFKRKELEVR